MSQAETCLVRLDGDLTIGRAQEVRDRLLAALKGSDRVVLDLAAVGEFDSAGVQLLLSAKRSAAAAGKSLVYAAPGETVQQAFALLGLDGALTAETREGSDHEPR